MLEDNEYDFYPSEKEWPTYESFIKYKDNYKIEIKGRNYAQEFREYFPSLNATGHLPEWMGQCDHAMPTDSTYEHFRYRFLSATYTGEFLCCREFELQYRLLNVLERAALSYYVVDDSMRNLISPTEVVFWILF